MYYFYMLIYLPIRIYLSTLHCLHLSFSIHLPIYYLSIGVPIYLLCVYLYISTVYLFISLPIYLPIYLPSYLLNASVYLSISISICSSIGLLTSLCLLCIYFHFLPLCLLQKKIGYTLCSLSLSIYIYLSIHLYTCPSLFLINIHLFYHIENL